MVLGIELLPLLLEDLPADCFVLADAVGIELPATALAALDELRGIVLFDLYSILAIDLFDVPLFETITPSLLSVVLLRLLSLGLSLGWLSLRWLSLWLSLLRLLPLRRFLVILITDRLIVLIPFSSIIILGVMLFHLIIHILIRSSLVASSALRLVIIRLAILIPL